MKLNPKNISMFRKKAKLEIATAEEMAELGAVFGRAFNNASGLKRVGLIGKMGVGKTTLSKSWLQEAQPLTLIQSHTLIGREQTVWSNEEGDRWTRHYDASATRFAAQREKDKLGSFSAYFRDVNHDGLDIVEHPKFEKCRDTGETLADYDYLLSVKRPSLKSENRTVAIYPCAQELKSEIFQQILDETGCKYGYF